MVFKLKTFSELTAAELYEILKARSEVFVAEQKIIYVDMDDIDYVARHCFLEENGRVVAYLRAFYEKEEKDVLHIGRVLTVKHGVGLGRLLMEKSVAVLGQNIKCRRMRLNSQTYAVGFYEKFGFKTVSREFLIENIPHYTMELEL